MTTKTTDFPTALKATLHDVFEAKWQKRAEQYSKVFDMETTFDAYEDELQIQGPDAIPSATEGSVYERVEIENVRSVRYTPGIFKGEVKISQEALDDVKYKQCIDAVGKLSTAAMRTALKCLKDNDRLRKELAEVVDPDRISVDFKMWQETQRKLKKVGWLLRWL